MDQQSKSSAPKEWKLLETFYTDRRPMRPGAELIMTVVKECPVKVGDHGNYDGDPRVTVQLTWNNRPGKRLHMTWDEACSLTDMVSAARETLSPKAAVVEEETQRRYNERVQRRAERKEVPPQDLSGGFGEVKGGQMTRRTGKTEREREKRKQRVQGQPQEQ